MQASGLYDLSQVVRDSILQEAAQRNKIAAAATKTSSSSNAGPSQDADAVAEEVDELLASYLDEKAKNDALAYDIESRLLKLTTQPTQLPDDGKTDRNSQELEWQQLEFAIQSLVKRQDHIPPLESTPVITVRTRAELQDTALQYIDALEQLRADLRSDKESLDREKQLLSDLTVVREGLVKRKAQLQQKRARNLTSESAIRDLSRKRDQQEQQFAQLLTKLIEIGGALFGSNDRKLVLLRSYLDAFMNRAWDFPLDPWVAGKDLIHRKRATEVDDAIIELFIRANLILPHPKDARRWRLVAFHKPTRSSA